MLISLANVCGIFHEIPFSGDEELEVERRVKAIIEADPVIEFLTRQVVAAKQSSESSDVG